MNKEDFNKILIKHFPSFNVEKPFRDQMTSVDLANLVVVIENEYNIEILPTELTSDAFENNDSLYHLILRKCG